MSREKGQNSMTGGNSGGRIISLVGISKRRKCSTSRVVTCSSDPQCFWAVSLPVDVAFVILDKLLEPVDHLHFAAICKLWRSVAKHYNHTTRRWHKLPPPMLILPGYNQDLIYSLSEAKVYHSIHLALPRYCTWYHACGNGWLAVLYSPIIQFVNPFTRATCDFTWSLLSPWEFGRRSTMPEQVRMSSELEKSLKLILFGDPGGNSFMLVAFYTTYSSLGFIRGGQRSWSCIETMEQYAITDAVFYKGQVYAVDKNHGRIVSFDVQTCTSGNSIRANILNTTNMPSSSRSYLVESTKGELLHVRRFLKVKREWDQLTMPVTLTFKVYKLVFDDNGYVVQQVELKSLGDQTLFVGDSQSMSVTASSFSWCRLLVVEIYHTAKRIQRPRRPCSRGGGSHLRPASDSPTPQLAPRGGGSPVPLPEDVLSCSARSFVDS